MATYNCYVRVYLPLNTSSKPIPSHFGHFDLQIDSANSTSGFPFDSHTTSMTRPVISYYGSNGAGYVKMFDETDVDEVITSDYLLCKFHFTTNTEKLVAFINGLKSMLTYRSSSSNGKVVTYQVTTGDFKNFTAARNNAFGATAIWCNGLGMTGLYNIYNSNAAKQNHMTYAAWALFDQLFTAWQFTDLNR